MFKTTFFHRNLNWKSTVSKSSFFVCHIRNSMKLFSNLKLFAADHDLYETQSSYPSLSLPTLTLVHLHFLYSKLTFYPSSVTSGTFGRPIWICEFFKHHPRRRVFRNVNAINLENVLQRNIRTGRAGEFTFRSANLKKFYFQHQPWWCLREFDVYTGLPSQKIWIRHWSVSYLFWKRPIIFLDQPISSDIFYNFICVCSFARPFVTRFFSELAH